MGITIMGYSCHAIDASHCAKHAALILSTNALNASICLKSNQNIRTTLYNTLANAKKAITMTNKQKVVYNAMSHAKHVLPLQIMGVLSATPSNIILNITPNVLRIAPIIDAWIAPPYLNVLFAVKPNASYAKRIISFIMEAAYLIAHWELMHYKILMGLLVNNVIKHA